MIDGHGWTFPLALGLALDAGIGGSPPQMRVHASDAALTLGEARTIALKAVPGGYIVSEELNHPDRQDGGTLHFSFQIRRGRGAFEVRINAMSGTPTVGLTQA